MRQEKKSSIRFQCNLRVILVLENHKKGKLPNLKFEKFVSEVFSCLRDISRALDSETILACTMPSDLFPDWCKPSNVKANVKSAK